jgi:hypothetical protein
MGMAMDMAVATLAAVMPAAGFMAGRFAAGVVFTEVADFTEVGFAVVVDSTAAAVSTVEGGSTAEGDPTEEVTDRNCLQFAMQDGWQQKRCRPFSFAVS